MLYDHQEIGREFDSRRPHKIVICKLFDAVHIYEKNMISVPWS